MAQNPEKYMTLDRGKLLLESEDQNLWIEIPICQNCGARFCYEQRPEIGGETYRSILLKCGHSMCEGCYTSLANFSSSMFICRSCKKTIDLDASKSLVGNRYIVGLVKDINSSKLQWNHTAKKEIKVADAGEKASKKMQRKAEKKEDSMKLCVSHRAKVSSFCKTCKKAVCQDCECNCLRDHETVKLAQQNRGLQTYSEHVLQHLRKAQEHAQTGLQEIEGVVEAQEKFALESVDKIVSHFTTLHARLQLQESECLWKVKKHLKTLVCKMEEEKQTLQTTSASLSFYTEALEKFASDSASYEEVCYVSLFDEAHAALLEPCILEFRETDSNPFEIDPETCEENFKVFVCEKKTLDQTQFVKTKLPEEEPAVEQVVFVISAVSPTEIHYTQTLEDASEQCKVEFLSQEETSDIDVGDFGVVKVTSQFFRCQVADKDETGLAVHLLDEGRLINTDLSDIRKTSAPVIQKCRLVRIDRKHVWTPETTATLQTLLEHKKAFMFPIEPETADFCVNDLPCSISEALVELNLADLGAISQSGFAKLEKAAKKMKTRVKPQLKVQFEAPEMFLVKPEPISFGKVESPDLFYIIDKSYQLEIEKLNMRLTEIALDLMTVPLKGAFCAVNTGSDTSFSRARGEIQQKLPDGTFRVLLIDSGTDICVPSFKIYELPEEYFTAPPGAILCSLMHIEPQSRCGWAEEVIDWFKTVTSHKNLLYTAWLRGKSPASGSFKAVIYQVCENFDICLNGLLVKKNWANSVGVESSDCIVTRAKVEKMEIISALGNLERRICVEIAEFTSATEFYVRSKNNLKAALLEEQIRDYMSSHVEILKEDQHPILRNRNCLVFSDEKWNRGQVESFENGTYLVFLIDFGIFVETTPAYVTQIPSRFLYLEPCAFKCKLVHENRSLKTLKKKIQSVGNLYVQMTGEKVAGNEACPVFLYSFDNGVWKNLSEELPALDSFDSFSSSSSDGMEELPVKYQGSGWIPAKLPRKTTFQARIVYIDGNCHIYLQELMKESKIERFLNDIQFLLADLPSDGEKAFRAGDICMAKNLLDKNWYRAVVLAGYEEGFVVQFVDFGNVDMLAPSELMEITVFDDVPIYCLKVKLLGIKPQNDACTWPKEVLEEIENALLGSVCNVELLPDLQTELDRSLNVMPAAISVDQDLALALVLCKVAEPDEDHFAHQKILPLETFVKKSLSSPESFLEPKKYQQVGPAPETQFFSYSEAPPGFPRDPSTPRELRPKKAPPKVQKAMEGKPWPVIDLEAYRMYKIIKTLVEDPESVDYNPERAISVEKPVDPDPKPADSDENPTNTDLEPAQTDSKLTDSDQKLTNTDPKSVDCGQKPAKTDLEPAESDQKSGGSDSNSAGSDPDSADSDPKKPVSDPNSTDSDQKPVETELESTDSEPEPSKTAPEPAKIGPEPANIDPEPAKLDPEPTNNDPEPAKLDPVPAKIDSEPQNAAPEPTKSADVKAVEELEARQAFESVIEKALQKIAELKLMTEKLTARASPTSRVKRRRSF